MQDTLHLKIAFLSTIARKKTIPAKVGPQQGKWKPSDREIFRWLRSSLKVCGSSIHPAYLPHIASISLLEHDVGQHSHVRFDRQQKEPAPWLSSPKVACPACV
jgi:hypothetical protein